MLDEIVLTLATVAVMVPLAAVGAAFQWRDFRPRWLAGSMLLFFVYSGLLTRGFWTLPSVFAGAEWNWTGKLMALAGMLVVAALPWCGWRRAGITLEHERGSWRSLALFVALSALFFYLAAISADGPADAETIAFQWTMPGLDEEVSYRGVLLVAMNEAFPRRIGVLGAPIGYGGLLTSVLFGLVHGLDYSAGAFSFDALSFLLTGVPSLLLLWMREQTGSLLLPVLGHNVANGASTLL